MPKKAKSIIFSFIVFITFFLGVASFTPINAQISELPQCGGPVLAGGTNTTFCSAICVGCAPVAWEGCPLLNTCWIGEPYQGCSGVDTSVCGVEQFDSEQCSSQQGGDAGVAYTQSACTSLLGGCFIPYPGISGGGVCVPPSDNPQLSCSNPPESSCNSANYGLCFNSTQEADLGDRVDLCDCWENIPGEGNDICYFSDAQSHSNARTEYEAETRKWGDDWCPVCPAGYDPSVEITGQQSCINGSRNPARVDPIEYQVCGNNQYCSFVQGETGGCRDYVEGCILNGTAGEANNVCSAIRSEFPFSCTIGNGDYCCPDRISCEVAGGESQECISISPLSGQSLACFNGEYEGYPIDCNATNFQRETYYCCKTTAACEDKNGKTSLDRISFEGSCQTAFGETGYSSAIGCISFTEVNRLVAEASVFLVGLGGGIAIVLIAYGSFLIMTSAGDPRHLQQGRDILFSAIAGLVMVILSVFVLRTIGVDILGLF